MKKNNSILVLIMFIFFVISFVTNILGPILPMISDDFHLTLGMAGFLPFSFFVAYFVMSIPAGVINERFGEKKSLLAAFALTFAGALLFVIFPTYGIVLSSLFIIGLGMAMLQVVILPLMREVGGDNNYAFNSVLSQVVFGLASFISPYILVGAMHHFSFKWSSFYFVFMIVFAFMLAIISLIKFPKVELKEEEKAGTVQNYMELIKNKYVILFFLGIFSYVGTEQGISVWISKFLNTYYNVNPDGLGATTTAWFWGLMTIGCLLGLVIVRLIDSKIMLRIFAVLAIINLVVALFAPVTIAIISFSLCGFFISIMFSVVFSLALNSVDKHHGAFAGILCTGIVGGAVVPYIIGWIGDFVGLRASMCILFLTISYILSISFWAKPLVNNKTVRLKELFKTNLFS